MRAAGTIHGLRNGITRIFETDGQGTYTVGSLPYGSYRLEIVKDGFATQSVLIDVQSATPISRKLCSGSAFGTVV